MMTEHERRFVRKPSARSKEMLQPIGYYFAYKDGVYIDECKLTAETKARYEGMGYTFKRRRG